MIHAELWLALSPRMRVLCWLLCTLCTLALVWWLAIRPLSDDRLRQEKHYPQQLAAQRAQWQKLFALSIPPDAFPASALPAFSPLDFQGQGRQIVRWQPTTEGGELVLETSWPAGIATFPLLAERGMQVPAFSLLLVENALQLTLRMERENAD